MGRLIVISNRLPFAINKAGDDVTIRQSSGGLVSALKSYFEKSSDGDTDHHDKIWIGSVDADERDWNEAVASAAYNRTLTLHLFFLTKKATTLTTVVFPIL